MGLKSPYERDSYKPNPEIPFIVIAGDVVLTALSNISSEFYHPDHGQNEKHIVIIQPSEPTNAIEKFLHDPNHRGKIKYLRGNIMNKIDLDRAGLADAQLAMILVNKYSKDSQLVD